MKDWILYISLPLLILGISLCIIAFFENTYNVTVSRYLAIWVLAQGIYFFYLGRKMALGLADYRIAAVILFLFGQLVIWWNWNQATENEEVGFAIGVIILAIGFLWGTIDHATKQELKEVKNRSD